MLPRSRSKTDPRRVVDDAHLADAVDEIVRSHPQLKRLQAKVIEAQERLRAVVDSDGWEAFLAVDEAVGERLSETALVIARWAFNQGVRSGGRQP